MKYVIAAALLFAAIPGALAATDCVTEKTTDYVYSGTTTSQLDRTVEASTSTCQNTIDENATATVEYQALRANDIKDRNAAYAVLGVCGLIFMVISLYRPHKPTT